MQLCLFPLVWNGYYAWYVTNLRNFCHDITHSVMSFLRMEIKKKALEKDLLVRLK